MNENIRDKCNIDIDIRLGLISHVPSSFQYTIISFFDVFQNKNKAFLNNDFYYVMNEINPEVYARLRASDDAPRIENQKPCVIPQYDHSLVTNT